MTHRHPLASPPPDHACSLDQVAAALNLSRARVRQIEARALFKVRIQLEERGIDEQAWRDYLHDLRVRHG